MVTNRFGFIEDIGPVVNVEIVRETSGIYDYSIYTTGPLRFCGPLNHFARIEFALDSTLVDTYLDQLEAYRHTFFDLSFDESGERSIDPRIKSVLERKTRIHNTWTNHRGN